MLVYLKKKNRKKEKGSIDSDVTVELVDPLMKALHPKSTVRKCSLAVYF